MKTIILGADNTERLFLKPARFIKNNTLVKVIPTQIEPVSQMSELIARHKARYYLVCLFLRPKYKILDFPCGSGYGAEIMKDFDIYYEGFDKCAYTIEYANRNYGNKRTVFKVNDLCNPKLTNKYNIIACIEGLEHIEKKYQTKLIETFYNALLPNGVLIISSPQNTKDISGKSEDNPYHLWELSRKDFIDLLHSQFSDVELITLKEKLHNQKLTTCFYGICRKE